MASHNWRSPPSLALEGLASERSTSTSAMPCPIEVKLVVCCFQFRTSTDGNTNGIPAQIQCVHQPLRRCFAWLAPCTRREALRADPWVPPVFHAEPVAGPPSVSPVVVAGRLAMPLFDGIASHTDSLQRTL